uniref:Early endosome antigen n=1 Tax=Rhizophora mucronata TaxID=61149 RepID=A0A2P2JZA7_RHIMU
METLPGKLFIYKFLEVILCLSLWIQKFNLSVLGLSFRLKNLSCQVSSLAGKANKLRRTGLLYKQRLERKCCDLQKAEAEVDLLGDEVDTLSSLLEKIYIALDHYSPILQHYPGVIEILKLVRRELSGDSVKPI